MSFGGMKLFQLNCMRFTSNKQLYVSCITLYIISHKLHCFVLIKLNMALQYTASKTSYHNYSIQT